MRGRDGVSLRGAVTKIGVGHFGYLSAVILLVLCLGTSPAAALDRMGPPGSRLKQGRGAVGVDYAWSETDLEVSGESVFTYAVLQTDGREVLQRTLEHAAVLDGVDMNRLYATLGYGVTDWLEVFLRLGGAQVDWQEEGGTHWAVGGGIRVTFLETGPLRVGGLAQVGWTEAEFDAVPMSNPFNTETIAMQGELSLYEIQAALAASWQLAESISLYGGPFISFIGGNLDLQREDPWSSWIPEIWNLSLESSYEIEETTQLGGYVGAQVDFTDQIGLGIEYQHTADAEGVAAGLAWRF